MDRTVPRRPRAEEGRDLRRLVASGLNTSPSRCAASSVVEPPRRVQMQHRSASGARHCSTSRDGPQRTLGESIWTNATIVISLLSVRFRGYVWSLSAHVHSVVEKWQWVTAPGSLGVLHDHKRRGRRAVRSKDHSPESVGAGPSHSWRGGRRQGADDGSEVPTRCGPRPRPDAPASENPILLDESSNKPPDTNQWNTRDAVRGTDRRTMRPTSTTGHKTVTQARTNPPKTPNPRYSPRT